MNYIFDGTIKENKLFVDKSEQFKQHLVSLNGKRVQVTVEKIKHKRSNNQNQYYWGVVVKLIAQHTGHDPEQIHELLKSKFSPRWNFQVGRGWLGIPTSTTRLDTLEFVEYTEKCRMSANEFLGLQIPLPGEVAE
jgi:ABC-type taurine transport system substrate-binding protein